MAEILPSDHVRVRNLSKVDFSSAYDSRPYTIPAGGDAIIPREAAAKDFGDWDKRNGRKNLRTKEYERLRGLYGALDGMPEADKRWEKNRPNVEIYETDGTRIVGVLDDPQGASLSAVGGEDIESQGSIDALRRQLARLEAKLEGRVEDEDVEVPEDTPEPRPRRKREAPIEAAREA